MGEKELDRMIRTVATAIMDRLGVPSIRPGKYQVWLTFVRRKGQAESRVVPGQKRVLPATTGTELVYSVASEVVLAVFGDLVRIVEDLPNLHVRLLDQSADVHLPGAPALDREGQIWLKVTVQRYDPGLLAQLFGTASQRRQEPVERTS